MPSLAFTLHPAEAPQRPLGRPVNPSEPWPTEWLKAWEDRARAIEAETNVSRQEAQRLAYHDVLSHPPAEPAKPPTDPAPPSDSDGYLPPTPGEPGETPDPWPVDPAPFIAACRAPWPPRPALLASWPIDLRERWGRRANALQDQGAGWADAERLAFLDLYAETTGITR